MEVDKNWNEKLLELFADSFPQFKFPKVEFKEKTEGDGSISYDARIKLLGQTFSSGPIGSKDEALESVCSIAYEVIKEFKLLVLSETDSSLKCEALSSLFRPLKEEAKIVASSVTQEALHSVSEIKNRLIEVENEKINQKVKTKSEKIVEKMQGAVQVEKPEPVKISKIEGNDGTRSTGISLSPLKIEEPKKQEEKERKTIIGAPIPTFYEFVEKQSSNETIIFDDYNKGYFFGSRLRWGKKFWVSPAEFKQKKDARNYAAVMACIECFGEGFTFEGVDSSVYKNWTRESVRQASDKYSFGNSDEFLEEENNKKSDEISVDPSKLKIEQLSDGRKFTSVLNEICQKLRMTPPNYQIASVNTLTNYYVCTVRNFHDLPQIESAPFTKKNESKEDAAGRIYYLLKQRGIVDEANRVIGRMKAFELASHGKGTSSTQSQQTRIPSSLPSSRHSADYIDERNPHSSIPHVTAPLSPGPIPAPIINPMTVPSPAAAVANMMPMMMMMSQIAQQSQQSGQPAPFDPMLMQSFMELSRQWQAFLAWQQQQQQQQQQYSPESQGQYNYPGSHDYQRYQGSQNESRHENRNNNNPVEYIPAEYNQYPSAEYKRDRHESRREYRSRSGRDQSPTDPRLSRETDEEYYARKRSYEESRRRH